MKENIKNFIKGIYAGIMIGIGGTIYLSMSSKVLGAIFFSIGLMMICIFNMNLYTGKIGYIINNKKSYLLELLLSLLGNFIGTYLVAFLINNTRYAYLSETAREISMIKINDSIISILILAMFCGILMFLAVDNYKKNKSDFAKYLGIFMCVIVFILSGFEHCIANMFYFSLASLWSTKSLWYILIMIIGNSIGAILINYYKTKIDID